MLANTTDNTTMVARNHNTTMAVSSRFVEYIHDTTRSEPTNAGSLICIIQQHRQQSQPKN